MTSRKLPSNFLLAALMTLTLGVSSVAIACNLSQIDHAVTEILAAETKAVDIPPSISPRPIGSHASGVQRENLQRFRDIFKTENFVGDTAETQFFGQANGEMRRLRAKNLHFETKDGKKILAGDVYDAETLEPFGSRTFSQSELDSQVFSKFPDSPPTPATPASTTTVNSSTPKTVSGVSTSGATGKQIRGKVVAEISPNARVNPEKFEEVMGKVSSVFDGNAQSYEALGLRKSFATSTLIDRFKSLVKNRGITIEIAPGGLSVCKQLGPTRVAIGADVLERPDAVGVIMHEVSHTFQGLPQVYGNEVILLREIDANLFGAAKDLGDAIRMTLNQYSRDLGDFQNLTTDGLRAIYNRFGREGNFHAIDAVLNKR